MKQLFLLGVFFFPIVSFGQDTIDSSQKEIQKMEMLSGKEEKFNPHKDKFARFPGDINAYLNKNIKYPAEAKKEGIQGRVKVEFDVDENGKIQNVKATKGIGYGCDEEAVRVVEAMPKWKPARKNKVPIRMSYMMNINFAL